MRPIAPITASEITVRDADYVRVTLAQLWEELPILIAGGILLALLAMPAAWLAANGMAPPAAALGVALVAPLYTALCYLAGRNAVGDKPRLSGMWSALAHYYTRSCLLMLPLAALLAAARMTLPLLGAALPILVITGIALQAIAALVACLLAIHAFPLLALFDLPLRQVWLYSLALVMRRPLVAVGLLSMIVLLACAADALGPGAWPLVPAVFVPFSVNATLMLTKQIKDAERTRTDAQEATDG
jgi:uncharacterized membrane protein YesL